MRDVGVVEVSTIVADEIIDDTVTTGQLQRRWDSIRKEMESLNSQNADSTTVLDYYIKFHYEIKDKLLSLKRDTGYIIMSKSYGIIKYDDYK